MPDQIRKAMVLFVPLVLLLVFAPLADSRMGGRFS